MTVARRFGQAPHEVAAWPPDWLAVTLTALNAEAGAEVEIRRREDTRAKARKRQGRG